MAAARDTTAQQWDYTAREVECSSHTRDVRRIMNGGGVALNVRRQALM